MISLFAMFYGGPDQLMPITSSIAMIIAVVLMFWNKVLVTFGKVINFFRPSPSAEFVESDEGGEHSSHTEN